jgi:hypothetical protein
MPSLIVELYRDEDPSRRGVDLAHLPSLPSLERSREFWAWAEANGFPSSPEDPDIWANVVAPDEPSNGPAIARREWPVSAAELAAYREVNR